MTNLEALVTLNLVLDIGSIRLKKLLEVFGKPENILKAAPDKLMAISGIGEKIAHKIHSLKKEDLEQELKLAKRHNLKIITLDDVDYPENLKNIFDPPIVLYVKGELKEEDKFSIAIVGSRRASFYGLSSAEKFAFDLSDKGFTIVSGMARGIDSSSHKGALKRGGRTIAVIGSGFNHIYPEENQGLCQKISKFGAAISEFPIDTLPLRQNFPRRNRLISGLSLGVLVVEAARNSGALITADFALEQGREVFALPGKVDSNTSFGTNGLIKQGAKLVESADDIIEELEPILKDKIKELKTNLPVADQTEKTKTLPNKLTDEEKKIYDLVSQDTLHLEEITHQSQLPVNKTSGILTMLELKGLVKQLPGKVFVRV